MSKIAKSIPLYSYLWPLIGLIALLFLVDMLQHILMPFVLGFMLAYAVRPLVIIAQQWGMKESWAILLVVSIMIMLALGFIGLLLPLIMNQASLFFTTLPEVSTPLIGYVHAILPLSLPDKEAIQHTLSTHITSILPTIGRHIATVSSSFSQHISSLLQLLIYGILTPYIMYNILYKWANIVSFIHDLIPKRFHIISDNILGDINNIVAGYLRGALLLSLTLGLFYSIALSLVSLPNAIAIGVITGLLSFIPFLGTILGVTFGMLAAFSYYLLHGSGDIFLWVGAIYIIGNILENAVLSPTLVGKGVGLNSLWIIFAILAGGTLFGFLGVMLAFPLFAIFGVIMRHIVVFYKKSDYYNA